jgi:hypothetical protein
MDIDPDRPRLSLRGQLHGTFAATYLTMLSIIQGVALADLANVVAARWPDFTIVNWILTVTAFCIIAEIWTHFMTDATSKGWIPGYGYSVLFFGLGAGELFLNHAIVIGLVTWLFGMMGAAFASLATLVFIRRREERDVSDAALLRILRRRAAPHRWHAIAGILVFGAAFLTCLLTGIGADDVNGGPALVSIGFALLSAAWVGILILITALHRHAVTRYVRTGQEPESLLPRLRGGSQ